jgi:hypothetical protein
MNLGKYYSAEYLKRLETTAKYPNRLKDRKKIETLYCLDEFGDKSREFFSLAGTLIAVGYDRIVYGDHGPYVEFELSNLMANLIPKFNNKCPVDAYYEWMTINDGSDIKIYRQLRDVKNLPNPPSPGFKGNRTEGYADYLPGKYYISPYEFKVNS